MSRTTQQLATAVLEEMGALDALSTPSAEDAALIKRVYADKHEMLFDRNLAYWPLAEIPNSIFLIVRDLVMNECSGAFGRPVTPEDKVSRETIILRRLRAHMGRESSGTRISAEYF